MTRLAAISVDLDEIRCYAAIHGLAPVTEGAERAIYRKALPRLRRLFGELDVRATFFAIGEDIDDENGAALRELVEEGHEVANHSLSHRYDLTRLPRRTIEREIREGADAIERATSVRPVGFRAPGYTITDEVFDVLGELGVRYDSSVFPCPAYYAAKVAAIQLIRARGRRSHSVIDDPRVLSAPANPYRVGRPYWRRSRVAGGKSLIELPVGVTRGPRLPYIGTTVVLSGDRGARLLTRAIVGRPLVSLELHGIDLADAGRDGLEFLVPHQGDLRRGVDEKASALRAAIGELRRTGHRFITCEQAASAFDESL